MELSTAQTVVKVFAILNWIGSAFAIIAGIMVFIVGPTMLLALAGGEASSIGVFIAGLTVIIGVFAILFGIISVPVGLGLWRHKNWARIVVLIFAVLAVLSVFGGNFLGAIIGALQIWLFGFDKTIIGLFK